jgi:DNA-directed RNA polymerase subunit omega
MLNPKDIEKLKGKESRYAVVIAIAKRAREIAENAEENSVILTEKPVSMAVNDFTEGDYKMMFPEND